ncbi:hypothetical protein [Microbispora sp. H10949]|uniref:hypothetical protein n=1 Tax=Microbispora sp. H10949 TaxID=2729111 RepID=UPI001602C77B|nr:hypothetical protein [Microbispora sp. H10949]
MVDGLWKGLTDRIAERWANVVLLPAALFWLGSGLVWLFRNGWGPQAAERWITQHVTSWWTASVLVVVLLSGLLARRLTDPALTLLSGRWLPRLGWVTRPMARRWASRVARREARWQVLASRNRAWAEEQEFVTLDAWLRTMPIDPQRCLPTRLGNALAAAERWPREKYGLDPVRCWSRLWLVMPEDTRQELARARGRLEAQVTAWLWSVAFVAWTPMAWWAAPVGVLAAWLSYRGAVRCVIELGDLQEAAFDLHRTALYRQLRWPPPENAAAEHSTGRRLTAYLWRGSDEAVPLSLD